MAHSNKPRGRTRAHPYLLTFMVSALLFSLAALPPAVSAEDVEIFLTYEGAVYDPGDEIYIPANRPVELNLSADDDGGQYRWTVDGVEGSQTSDPALEVDFSDAGRHTVRAAVMDTGGTWSESQEMAILVDAFPPVAEITFLNTTGAILKPVVDEDTYVRLSGSMSRDTIDGEKAGKVAKGTWTVVGFSWGNYTETSADDIRIEFSEPGEYTVILEVTDAVGLNDTIQRTLRVRDTTPPLVVIDGPSIVICTETITLNANRSFDDLNGNAMLDEGEDQGLNFTWDLDPDTDTDGDGYQTNDVDMIGPAISLAYSRAGVADVHLNVTDASGNWQERKHSLHVQGSELTVTKVTTSARATGDGRITVEVSIENWGDVHAGEFLAHISVDRKRVAHEDFEGLEPGGILNWTEVITIESEGKHIVSVNITGSDGDKIVPCDEQNGSPWILGREVVVEGEDLDSSRAGSLSPITLAVLAAFAVIIAVTIAVALYYTGRRE